MKKVILLALCLMLLPTTAMAIDCTGIYVAPRLTYSAYTKMNMKGDTPFGRFNGSENDHQWGGAFAVGWDSATLFNIPLRTEIEIGIQEHTRSDYSSAEANFSQTIDTYTLFLNAYYDFVVTWPAKPYVGLGVGMSLFDSKGNITNNVTGEEFRLGGKNQVNFAANAMAGFSFAVTDNFGIDLGYRFAYLGDAKTKGNDGYRMKSDDVFQHMGSLGFRITF